MPSTCPKCHAVLEQDEICCSQVRYTWRCTDCHKLTTGFVLPYGKCFLCGGKLEVIEGRDLGDSMRFRAIRDAVQFELNSFHFYKLARARAKDHAHLDRAVIDLTPTEEKLLSDELFAGLPAGEEGGIRGLYEAALAMERRTRDHFRKAASELPAGLENELCLELAAEEEEHVAMLETEIEQLG